MRDPREKEHFEADIIERFVDKGVTSPGDAISLSSIKSWVATADEPAVEEILNALDREAGTGFTSVPGNPDKQYYVRDVSAALDRRDDVREPGYDAGDYDW